MNAAVGTLEPPKSNNKNAHVLPARMFVFKDKTPSILPGRRPTDQPVDGNDCTQAR